MCFAGVVKNRRPEESEVRDSTWNVETPRQRNCFATVTRFQPRQFFEILVNQVRETEEQSRSLRDRHLRPRRKRLPRCANRDVDITLVGDKLTLKGCIAFLCESDTWDRYRAP